ncbi:hypothetical protein ACFLXT_01985 [Chloroflexota bacterium]
MSKSNALSLRHQQQWKKHPIYNEDLLSKIDLSVQLHTELRNVRSSAASCINVLGNIANHKKDLIAFLNEYGLEIEDIISFPTGALYEGERYMDSGYVVFEWIGPQKSPLNEVRGKRGQNRTSIDAFILARIKGKVTQLLIEWKFSETYNGRTQLQKFAGIAGTERLRRYSLCLAKLRKLHDFPLKMSVEGGFGLHDLGYEPYYQLLRMTLLAKLTTPFEFDTGLRVEDYRIIHLSHSQNDTLNILSKIHLSCTLGLRQYCGKSMHEVWKDNILSEKEATKFYHGYWDEAINVLPDGKLKKYLTERYI